MAEVTAFRNNALPYPIYGAPWTFTLPIFDADGDLVSGATGLDSERSLNGDTPADCTNEATEIGSSGEYYLTLTGTEMTADNVTGVTKTSSSGAKTTPWEWFPRKLVTIRSGTAASAGSATDYIVLDSGASAEDDFYNGMVVIATIDGNVEVRVISDYTGSNKRAAVVPDWNVAPDSDDTFVIKLPEGPQLHQANVTQWAGGAVATPNTAGVPLVDVVRLLGTLFTESAAGRLVANIKTFFNVASATGTQDVIPTVTTLTNAPSDSAGVGTLLTRLTSTRASYLDNLSGGAVALQADVLAIQNNTRVVFTPPTIIERPDSGTQVYQAHLLLYDEAGNMEAPDSAPTLTLTNPAGTDRSSRLDSATMTLVEPGHYKVVYTADAADALEELEWTVSVVEGSVTRKYFRSSLIVDTTAVDFTSSDRTLLTALAAGVNVTQVLGTAAGSYTWPAADDAVLAAIAALNNLSAAGAQTAAAAALAAYNTTGVAKEASVQTVSTNVSAIQTVLTGITSLANWLRAGLRKSAPDATALSEINSGGGTYSGLTDANEAIRDALGGGGGSDPLANEVPGDYESGTAGYALGRIGSGQIRTTSTVTQTGDIVEIEAGADYSATDGFSFDWTDAENVWPTLTSAAITVSLSHPSGATASYSGTVVTATGSGKKVRLELTAAESAALAALGTGVWSMMVWATLSGGHVRPLVGGTARVKNRPGPS